MKIAGIQISTFPDVERNLQIAWDLIKVAGREGAKLTVFQQLFAWPWFPLGKDPDAFGMAWAPDSPAWKMLSEWAQEFQTTLVAPVFEATEDGRYFNTAVVYGPDGKEIGRYRKVHVPNFERYYEGFYFSPGDLGYPVFDTPAGKLGVALCYDNFYPEVHRSLTLQGADLIVTPTAASVNSGRERWLTVIASQAITNGIDIFRVNRAGHESGIHFYGESFVINSAGELLDQPSGETTAVYLMNLDWSLRKEVRERFPYHLTRRPETYGMITAPVETPSEEPVSKAG